MELLSRMVAAAATVAMLLVLFVMPSARADHPGKAQDRLSARAIVADVRLERSDLLAAAQRQQPTITVETRVGPNTSVLTRVSATLAQR